MVRQRAAGALASLALNAENNLLIAREEAVAPLVALLRENDPAVRKHAVNVLRALVNVSLWYEQDIAVVLETQKQKEDNAEIKSKLDDILSHWQKKPDLAASTQASFRGDMRSVPREAQITPHKLSPPDEGLRQSADLPAIGDYSIHGSKVQLGRSLGQGAFGGVYEAIYQFQKVAVKKYVGAQLRPSDRTKIMAEIALMVSLTHKYLVACLGVIEETSGIPSLVMERAERRSLYGYLGAHPEIAWSGRLRAADELARGLASLHEKNVVHQDIKSLNVVWVKMCMPSGVIWVWLCSSSMPRPRRAIGDKGLVRYLGGRLSFLKMNP